MRKAGAILIFDQISILFTSVSQFVPKLEKLVFSKFSPKFQVLPIFKFLQVSTIFSPIRKACISQLFSKFSSFSNVYCFQIVAKLEKLVFSMFSSFPMFELFPNCFPNFSQSRTACVSQIFPKFGAPGLRPARKR